MNNTLFLVTSQFFSSYNIKIVDKETTIVDVFNYVLSNDLIHTNSIEIYQSDSGMRRAGWGQIVYKINEDGTLEYHHSDIDSSG